LAQRDLQLLFAHDPGWPRYATEHCYVPLYRARFEAAGLDCDGETLCKPPYRFPNVFKAELDYQVSFFSEICDYVLPALLDDTSMYAEGPAEHGPVRLDPGNIVIDAGANIGLFSLLAAAKGCEVHAFEPIPEVARCLDRAVTIFPSIRPCPFALSDRTGVVDMALSEGTSTGHSFMIEAGSRTLQVDTITLDNYVASRRLRRVDFIKADIEGAERHLLRGARETLRNFAPRLSICTYHFPEDPQLLEALVREANPAYVIEHRWQKMYAHVPPGEGGSLPYSGIM
jgi:FkbM family methyltransferase